LRGGRLAALVDRLLPRTSVPFQVSLVPHVDAPEPELLDDSTEAPLADAPLTDAPLTDAELRALGVRARARTRSSSGS
jgi:hypothetical protein